VRQAHPSSRLREARFSRVFARDSIATELLQGCPVVTAEGKKIGSVDALLIDKRTNKLRYVMLSRTGSSASVAIPWHTLYFDSAMARLVFYTFS
jgi:hypothetical protein